MGSQHSGLSTQSLLDLDSMRVSKWLAWVDLRSSLVFAATLLAGFLWKSTQRRKNFPPGPTIWPFIGNLPQIWNAMRKYNSQFKMFDEFAKQFGPVFSLRLGSEDMIMVTGFEEIKEVLQTNALDFINRPSDSFTALFNRNNGMLFANGQKWEEIRKFTVVALRDFGVGKRSLEQIIQTEAETICEKMASEKKPFHPESLMGFAVANVIFSIVFGDRFEYNDPDFAEILNKVDYMTKTLSPTMIDRFFPFLKYLPVDTPMKKVLRRRNELEKYTYKRIQEHRNTYNPSIVRDYIDLYIKITEEGHKYTTLTEPHIFQTILDLYVAGAETTSVSLDWFILYMIIHPEVQERVQKEIDVVVGLGRKVSMVDKKEMPYTVAVMHELQRIANVAPSTVPHCSTKDTQLKGYFIPKNTMVLVQLLSVHLNPQYFPDPLNFKPERWLDENNQLIKDEHFLPFGIGPRKCVGENLAKMELFLFMTNFLQNYNFKLAEGDPLPSTEGTNTGIFLHAQPYNVTVERRS